MSSSARARLLAVLDPIIPIGADGRPAWAVKDHSVVTVGELDRTGLFVDYSKISPLLEAPPALVDGFEISIVSHRTDWSVAEDEIDDHVLAFIRQIDRSSQVAWSAAEKLAVGERLAWKITAQLISPEESEDIT